MKCTRVILAPVLMVCYASSSASAAAGSTGSVVRFDPALDSLVQKDARVEELASGFHFTEGPLWRSDGRLWFSDLVDNVIRSLTPSGQVQVLIRNAGGETHQPAGSFVGPNGMVADKDGYVLLCQHTCRRIARVSRDLQISSYLDKYQGSRLNSPNDLVYKSDGALYFTDPPFGLPKQDDDSAKQLTFNGVFRYAGGQLRPVIRDLPRPNGIAFSPDEKTLYVSNSDEKHKVWMRYDVNGDGGVANGRVLFDVTSDTEEGLPDGMKVDAKGNLYCAGPGGIWVFSPNGNHLGTIRTPQAPANCNWGDDGRTLYITARTHIYRIKLMVEGKPALYR